LSESFRIVDDHGGNIAVESVVGAPASISPNANPAARRDAADRLPTSSPVPSLP